MPKFPATLNYYLFYIPNQYSAKEGITLAEAKKRVSKIDIEAYERNGFDEYMFITNGGCCDICAELNGKHFKVSKMMTGLNAPFGVHISLGCFFTYLYSILF